MFAQESDGQHQQQQQPASSPPSPPTLDVSKLAHLTERQQLAFLMRATQMRHSPRHGSAQPSAPRATAAAPLPPPPSSSKGRQQQRSAKPSMLSDDKKRRSSAAASSARRHSAAAEEHDDDGVVYTVHKLPPAASSPLPLPRPAAYSSWPAAQQRRWNGLRSDPNAFYYHHSLSPAPSSSAFSASEQRLFLHLLLRHPPRGQWGLFALNLPGRTGRQCELLEQEMRSRGELPSTYHFDYRAWYEEGRQQKERQSAASQTPATAAPPVSVTVLGRKRLQAPVAVKPDEAEAAGRLKTTEQVPTVSLSEQSQAAQPSSLEPSVVDAAVSTTAVTAVEERRKVKTVRFRELERQAASGAAASSSPHQPAAPAIEPATVGLREPRVHPMARASRRLPPQPAAADSAASSGSSLPALWIPRPPVLSKPAAISDAWPLPSSAVIVPSAAALSSLSRQELAVCRAQALYEVRLRRLQSYQSAEESRAEQARKRGRDDSSLSSGGGSSSRCTALYGRLEANAGRLRAAYYAEYRERECEDDTGGGEEAMAKRLRSVRQCVAEMRRDVQREYEMEIEMLRSMQEKL